MKAIVCDKYGAPDVLRFEDVPMPSPGPNEVLIKIAAASLNATDMELLAGKPFFVRLGGLRAPMHRILGSDIAGHVQAVGSSVTKFKPGDAVFGDLSDVGFGGLAEYVCVPDTAVIVIPEVLSMEDAAAIPQAGVLALQGLRDNGRLAEGQHVLINGAGGGAGTFAIQIAKYFGAEVTGVDHSTKLDIMRAIGADHVIDYTLVDFTRRDQQYDLILDTVAHHSMLAYRGVLKPGGRFVMIGGSTGIILQAVSLAPLLGRLDDRSLGILMGHRSAADLLWIADRVVAGEITPVIGDRYLLRDTPKAMRRLIAGRAMGKLVIQISEKMTG